jgi:glycosyltransferase involved in cell wall biosynthesis
MGMLGPKRSETRLKNANDRRRSGRAGNRIVIDILGSPAESGGMRLHATQIVEAWASAHVDDHLVILGPEWAVEEFDLLQNVRVVSWPNKSIVPRALGQMIVAAVLFMWTRSDLLISLSPVVSPLVPRKKAVCFEHDWRHLRNPEEFGRAQRAYRWLWKLSARRSSRVICISRKTELETLTVAPRAHTVIVPNGGDHPKDWGMSHSPAADGPVVTFGHHNNKRPELVIRALAEVPGSRKLLVLGARGRYADELMALADSLGIGRRLDLPGFVDERRYREIIASAGVIVMASSDEGFGLPVAEANYFGIPAVVTRDSGLEQIHPGRVLVAEPDASAIAEALRLAFERGRGEGRPVTTWGAAVQGLREAVGIFDDAHHASIGRTSA